MASVLIADGSAFERALLRDVLAGDHEVVGEVENGVEAVEVFGERRPDLVVMAVSMPIRDGIEATDEITTEHADASVVAYASRGEERATEAFEAGADEYVVRPFQRAGVMAAVERAAQP